MRARWTTRLTARDFPADALGDLKKLNAAISNTAGLLLVVSR